MMRGVWWGDMPWGGGVCHHGCVCCAHVWVCTQPSLSVRRSPYIRGFEHF